MKKKQVNEIFIDQVKRRKIITSYISIIIIFFTLTISFAYLFINSKKAKYVKYNEKSNLTYKVNLKENEFFTNTQIDKKNRYIASLIDSIDANFDYNLILENKKINYQYSYKIEADVTVKEKNSTDNLYHYKEDLLKEKKYYSNSSDNININEDIKIDYNKYNNLIKKFISVYGIEDTESTLNINMYVTAVGNCSEIENAKSNSVITLSIPLTTKTVGVDLKYNLVDDDEEKLLLCNNKDNLSIIYLIISIIILLVDFYMIYKLMKYIINTRSVESIYNRELKKILNNYKSYIQKINSHIDLKKYEIVKVDTFTDMLEISDKVNQPILMSENKKNTGVYFIIPSSTLLMYVYAIKVSDIKKEKETDEEVL